MGWATIIVGILLLYCFIFTANSTLNILNDVHCLPLGNDTCEEDKECCSKNCVIEHDDLYGVCKTPGTQPKSQENFFCNYTFYFVLL